MSTPENATPQPARAFRDPRALDDRVPALFDDRSQPARGPGVRRHLRTPHVSEEIFGAQVTMARAAALKNAAFT